MRGWVVFGCLAAVEAADSWDGLGCSPVADEDVLKGLEGCQNPGLLLTQLHRLRLCLQ